MDIYFIAIGGTGMAPLACLMKRLGHQVRGSDGPLYPPMSDLLAEAGIVAHEGYDPAHLELAPDLVVVGNAVHRSNVEAVEVERRGIERISMPEALERFVLPGRRPLVVAGSHGKTTTSSMAAWVWTRCGCDPGFLVGGAPLDLDGSFRLGGGERFVLEGDEYNAAYFDRGAKFLHYQPESVILTSIEYDHADLYQDERQLVRAFEKLVQLVPESGTLVACLDYPVIDALLERSSAQVLRYSAAPGAGATGAGREVIAPLAAPSVDTRGTAFEVEWRQQRHQLKLRLFGSHNVANAIAVFTMACVDGIDPADAAAALAEFRGVKRRLEELGRPGDVVVVDDFAHHPTEVGKSLEGLRSAHPDRRLVVLFEPRSLTAGRRFLHQSYLEAFAAADVVFVAPVFHAARFDAAELLDRDRLVADLRAEGKRASAPADIDRLFQDAVGAARPGDVLVTMSSGSFDGLPQRVLETLAERLGRA